MNNAQKNMDALIERAVSEGKAPSLLLHACCAPCSSYVLEYLSQYFHITVLYYNPNITFPEEYGYRLGEVERLIKEIPHKYPITLIRGDYNPDEFFEAVKGLEDEPEGGARCAVCIPLRMEATARKAAAGGFEYFCTTLSVSPHKDAELINRTGESLQARFGVKWLPSDFKKRNGFLRTTQLCTEMGIYRQAYCGCMLPETVV